MVYKALIQNYYELHGSFKGVEIQPYISTVRKRAESVGMSLLDYCYFMLGYNPICFERQAEFNTALNEGKSLDSFLEGALPPTKVAELHDAWMHSDFEQINSILPNKTVNEVNAILQDSGCCMKSVDNRTKKKHVAEINALAYYFAHQCDQMVEWQGRLYTIPFLMALAKQSKGMSLKTLMDSGTFDSIVIKCMRTDSPEVVVSDGVLYTNKVINDKTLNTIKSKALTLVHLGYVADYVQSFRHTIGDFIWMGLKDRKGYLALLNLARLNGMTYAELVEQFRYKVVDQSVVFENTGMCVVKIQNKYFCIPADCSLNNKDCIVAVTEEEIGNMLLQHQYSSTSMNLF